MFLPLVEISTAQRVLSFAIGCFIRSLTTRGGLFDVRDGFGYLNKIFFNWTERDRDWGGKRTDLLRAGLESKKRKSIEMNFLSNIY